MELLLKLTDKDLLLLLSAKTLLCKIYHELEEWRVLENHLHSFGLYIRRQKSIGYHKQNYTNFVRCMKKLSGLNFYDSGEVEQLKAEIEGFTILPEKRWLLGKLG